MGRLKKIGFIIGLLSLSLNISAQYLEDVTRIADQDLPGSAYTKSLGGAQSTVANIGAVSTNPALGALLDQSAITVSHNLGVYQNSVDFIGLEDVKIVPNLYIGNASLVLNSETLIKVEEEELTDEEKAEKKKKSKYSKYAFGFTLNRTNNFKERMHFDGVNSEKSITEYFGRLSIEEGTTNQFIDFNNVKTIAQMALITYLTSYDSTTDIYSKGIASGGGNYQNYEFESTGSVNDVNFSFSNRFGKKLFIGASVGIITYKYSFNKILSEEDTDDIHPYFDYLRFEENYSIDGSGINFKIGSIYKPSEWLNIGITHHSGNNIVLFSEYNSNIEATHTSHPELFNPKDSVSTEYANISTLSSNFNSATPSQTILGLSIQDEKVGILSADIERINYSKASYTNIKTDNPLTNFDLINSNISSKLKASLNIKFGAQYNYKDNRVRIGYAMYNLGGNSYNPRRNYITLGYGVEKKYFIMNIAYIRQVSNREFNPYQLSAITLKSNKMVGTNIVISFGIKF